MNMSFTAVTLEGVSGYSPTLPGTCVYGGMWVCDILCEGLGV